ncbi:helix-turn-helix domain-containing protein [Nonomuraea sp. K274]|uniref:Helix-turn-helix domain-containing protein n=1 Tax=Nonomuraea cypriaca TaxID=1187855 RepID=A0A931A6N7_9ACTN|nr:helix-turn-helix domain-containing protein [Nonomuraea cypriaca]MBF8187346.1 helix-turn-helix domain-containing protein [Nonomuraea cypriaca]
MLTIPDVCARLRVSRSTVLRKLHTGQLAGEKRHACGSLCSAPKSCKQGEWRISEASVKASEGAR